MIKQIIENGLRCTFASKTDAKDDTAPYFKIRQKETGLLFESAVDVEDSKYTYEETNIIIEN